MTKNDKLLIAFLLTISVIVYFLFLPHWGQKTSVKAEILVEGNTFAVIELNNQNQLINITGPLGISVAEVKMGKIRMKSSPCPDHYCMEMGWISKPNQVIACVPNRIIIKIISGENNIDSIVH